MNDLLYYVSAYTGSQYCLSTVAEYEYVIELLSLECARSNIDIHCYAILPNQLHLLLEADPGCIVGVINHINRFYTKFHKGAATLIDRFNEKIIEKNQYALDFSYFIHALPALNGCCVEPIVYPWSSAAAYCDCAYKIPFINKCHILQIVSARLKNQEQYYRSGLHTFIKGADTILDTLRMDMEVIGSKTFRRFIHAYLTSYTPSERKFLEPDDIKNVVTEKDSYHDIPFRAIQMYFCYLFCGVTYKKLSSHFGGVSAAYMSRCVHTVHRRFLYDFVFADAINRLRKMMRARLNVLQDQYAR